MNTRVKSIVFLSLALCFCAVIYQPAGAALQVDITKSSDSALPIAIVPFGSRGALPVDIAKVAGDDLASTGLFTVFDRRNMVARPSRPAQVNYANWQTAAVDNLVVGSVAPAAGDQYRLTFNLLDVPQQRSVASFEITAGADDMRSAAHTVANLIYQRFIGKKGYFLSRIAYITVTNDNGARRFRLVVSDYDGNNPHTVYSSRDPIMSPAWSPDGTKLAYVAFDIQRGRTSLRVQDLASGNVREISSRPGINGAPAWSPDGTRLALALSYQGDPDIYVYNLSSDTLSQLTDNSAIDTEPSWSANGRYIAFTSDRGGRAQIYRMTNEGDQVERLTFDGQSNQSPVYSPDGDTLAMVQQSPNGFRIAVMELGNNNIKIVSRGPLDDSPSFAPDGQAIIYAKQGQRNELATVSVDGNQRARLSEAGDVREPAWGPSGY